jgi:hypothetical protein
MILAQIAEFGNVISAGWIFEDDLITFKEARRVIVQTSDSERPSIGEHFRNLMFGVGPLKNSVTDGISLSEEVPFLLIPKQSLVSCVVLSDKAAKSFTARM